MTFTRGETKVVLNGDATLTKAEVSMKMMISEWGMEDEGFLVEFKGMSTEREEDAQVDSEKVTTLYLFGFLLWMAIPFG